MVSTKIKIKEGIEASSEGSFYFAEDFLGLANNEQVRLALSRLAREGILMRIAQGLYYYPKIDPHLGKVKPGMDEIAYAIAARQRIQIRPTGAYALNKLGLSTQVPMNAKFLTDGHPRVIKIGKRRIEFINRSQRKMAYEGEISGDLIIALEEMGSQNLTKEIFEKIIELFSKEDKGSLRHDLKLAPNWIREAFVPKLLYKIDDKHK